VPVNAREEQQMFWAHIERGQIYNPQFRYPPLDFSPEILRAKLANLGLTESVDDQTSPYALLVRCSDHIEQSMALLEARTTSSFSELGLRMYGYPDVNLQRSASEYVNVPTSESDVPVSAADLQMLCLDQMRMYKLVPGWQVRLRDAGASRIATNSENKTVFIRRDARFSKEETERILAHEIGTHVLRGENGWRQPVFSLLAHGLPDYLGTEEGLAVVNESLTGGLDVTLLQTYALRVLAVAWARSSSFYATYELLCAYLPPKRAYDLAVRVKRGLGDTSLPGCFPKDYLYYSGWLRVKHYQSEGGNLSDLYVGKVGLDDLPLAEQLRAEGLITPPELLPVFYN